MMTENPASGFTTSSSEDQEQLAKATALAVRSIVKHLSPADELSKAGFKAVTIGGYAAWKDAQKKDKK